MEIGDNLAAVLVEPRTSALRIFMGPRQSISPCSMRFGILTSISEVYVNQTEDRVHGVRVERFRPLTPLQGPRPIVFVHGGCHGSWSWVHFLPYFAQAGWDCHALNWFGHDGSAPHPEVGLLQRGIADVTQEIAHVAGQFEESPVIVAHSMGALAAQKYAECATAAHHRPVEGLAVVPGTCGASPHPAIPRWCRASRRRASPRGSGRVHDPWRTRDHGDALLAGATR